MPKNDNKNNQILLLKYDPSWISFFESEGLSFSVFQDSDHLFSDAAILVMPNGLSSVLIQKCKKLIQDGASVICEKGISFGPDATIAGCLNFNYEKDTFCGLKLGISVPNVIVETAQIAKGKIFFLSFLLSKFWDSWEKQDRYINIGGNSYVFETMSAVIKKNVRQTIVEIIKQAFFRQGLPFVHKWYYPGQNRSVVSYRGDADGGQKENFYQWLDAVRPFACCTSVFFCTSKYADKPDLIAAAKKTGLEIGSHNHWHIVFLDRMTNLISLRRAERILNPFGNPPRGFVAPAFFWHPSLYRLLEKYGYLYESSFRINHDSMPYFPVVDGKLGKVLEIPFHCLGDRFPLCDIPLDGDRTRSFFKALIKKKYAAGEPMFLYGHPDVDGRMGTTPELVGLILETARSFSDVKPMQPADFAKWWHKRKNINISCSFNVQQSKIYIRSGSMENQDLSDIMVHVEFPDGRSFLADISDCQEQGMAPEQMIPISPLQIPKADDIGEVVYNGPDNRSPWFGWRKRRQLERFLRAYYQVYASFFRTGVSKK